MSTPPPPDFLSTLGPDIKMDSKKMENDPWSQMMLKEIGSILTKDQQAQGMEYVGSFAFHIIRTKQDYGAMTGKWEMNSITQIGINEDCSEQLATLAFNNGVISLRRYFNPNFKSGRRGDAR